MILMKSKKSNDNYLYSYPPMRMDGGCVFRYNPKTKKVQRRYVGTTLPWYTLPKKEAAKVIKRYFKS